MVHADHDGFHVEVHPFRPDLRISWLAVGGIALLFGFALLRSQVPGPFALETAAGAAGLACVIGFGTVGLNARVRARRLRSQLEVRVGRDDLRVLESTDGVVTYQERVYLREIGHFQVVDARGPHLLGTVTGRALLRIPMELHPRETAVWLAAELTQAGRAARERDGAGVGEIPDELRRLTE